MNRRTLVITVVLLSVTINMCQGVVLCLGSDGHVAVEAAGHEHCCDGGHGDASEPEARVGLHASEERCVPCVDVPLSIGIREDRPSSHVVEIKACVAHVDILPADSLQKSIAESVADGAGAYITSYQLSLRSVVLQV